MDSIVRGFYKKLQHVISPSDHKWEYAVPDLPGRAATDSSGFIKCISFVSTGSKQYVQLRFEKAPESRITRKEPLVKLILLSFSGFRLRLPDMEDGKVQMASARESASYIEKLLKTGIVLNGTRYHFFGHSNSQLKSRSCFMYAATREEISAKIEALGDFSKMKTVGKKAKRIGLLFSTAKMAIELDPRRTEDIDDLTRDGFIFTDGCGLISDQLSRLLAQRRNIVFRNKRYLPSVFQIRYRGYKGVLTRYPALEGEIQIQFRESMRKFKDVHDYSFAVVEYSKPYAFGYLNDEIILLLHALGIETEVLLHKQTQYLDFLRQASMGAPMVAFQFLSYAEDTALAEQLLMDGVEAVRERVRKLVRGEYSKMVNKKGEQKCRIMIPDSRLLFGICDPTGTTNWKGKLREGTCFVRITDLGSGLARTLINTEVLVTRNPTLHPGDLQKLKVVDVPEWKHLTDCIVFSTCGRRPTADISSGGDLDGDKFFVAWDPDIIPRTISQPAAYPGVKERIEFEAITDDRRAEYFAKSSNASLGRVKNLYLKWSRLGGPMSAECQQLNRLFSQCVDGNDIKVPSNLEDPPESAAGSPPFVLDILHGEAESWISAEIKKNTRTSNELSEDIVDFILSRDGVAISEFHLIRLVFEKCQRDGINFLDYTHHFNYSALSDEHRAWLLGKLPPMRDMPNLVRNGLLQSELVTPAELRRFRLDHHGLHWKPVFTSSTDRMGRFLDSTSRSLELFHKKLIILQADERLSVMIYVPEKIARASEVDVNDSVRVFGLPRSSGPDSVNYHVTPTIGKSRIYCDDGVFQLYEGKRANTFVFLTRGQQNKSSFQHTKNTRDRRLQQQKTLDAGENYDCRASIALQKISSPIQQHVGAMNRAGIRAAEVYVISNRDVESMHLLDQWLHFVDTEEVLPLFDSAPREYRKLTLKDFEESDVSPAVKAVVWNQDLSTLKTMSETDDIRRTLQILVDANEKSRLQVVFRHLLDLGSSKTCSIGPLPLLRQLVRFLPDAVFLTETLMTSQLWLSCKDSIDEEITAILPTVLHELVLNANRLRAFVKQPFLLTLKQLKQLTMQQLADLVELIALSVESPEIALDLLMECIETESSRILTETPLEIQQFVSHTIGIALNHIDEASSNHKISAHTLRLQPDGTSDGFQVVKANLRIDVPEGPPKQGDHIRLLAQGSPLNVPIDTPYAMDAVVLNSTSGSTTLRCLHRPPSYVADCAWKYKNCGSFVTSKAMLDAVTSFYATKEACCRLYRSLVRKSPQLSNLEADRHIDAYDPSLNESQNRALKVAFQFPLVLLWGPPGTGKTQTIVTILMQMLAYFNKFRFLVTAPTHNAVDNILQRLISMGGLEAAQPLRVSTNLSKVAPGLRQYTCDAMVGKDLSEGFKGRREAQKRIKESRLVFTTCVGAALGLLRDEQFDIVLVDEASQQTEPETLIPLTKGCERAILVGDHVQLRATIQKHAVVTGFDISLFERLYTLPGSSGIARVMLDTQYRMHPDVCAFSSTEFYDGKLKSAESLAGIRMPQSQFPWPKDARKVFIQCSSTEDLGRQSKSNRGQVQLCQAVCKLLSVQSATSSSKPDIAILTPYTEQRKRLEEALPSYKVSSIDGYQGREADIIIFVTVRCNNHYEIGFLKDLRRLNVAMTRTKSGVIVIGDKTTLTGQVSEDADAESKAVWKRLLEQCTEVKLPESDL